MLIRSLISLLIASLSFTSYVSNPTFFKSAIAVTDPLLLASIDFENKEEFFDKNLARFACACSNRAFPDNFLIASSAKAFALSNILLSTKSTGELLLPSKEKEDPNPKDVNDLIYFIFSSENPSCFFKKSEDVDMMLPSRDCKNFSKSGPDVTLEGALEKEMLGLMISSSSTKSSP